MFSPRKLSRSRLRFKLQTLSSKTMSNYMKVMGKQVPETYTECLHHLVMEYKSLIDMMIQKDQYTHYDEMVEITVGNIIETSEKMNKCDDRITTYCRITNHGKELMQLMTEGF
jgi:hypothetical protein